MMTEQQHQSTETPAARERRLRKRFDQKLAVFIKTDGRCWYCGVPLDFDTFHSDHVVAASRGGPSTLDNLVPACHPCNSAKHNRDLEEFRLYRQRQREGAPWFSREQLEWLA